MTRCVAGLLAVLLAGCIASPALAWHHRHVARDVAWHRTYWGDWRSTHWAIYELGNRIALLEADPQTDDGYRAPIITRARADIWRLRARLGPAQWRWTSPCCYSRPTIRIR